MTFLDYLAQEWAELVILGRISFLIVLYAVLVATAISVLVGIVLYTNRFTPESWSRTARKGSQDTLLVASALALTVPSLALFGLLQKVVGLGATITIAALVIYGIYPILRNVVAGLNAVDPAVLEAAKGVGMGAVRRMVRVQLPLAWPVILSGLRVATLILIAIHVVGGAFGTPGYPDLLVDGLAGYGTPGGFYAVVSAVIGCVVIALVYELVFLLVKRLTTPRGIRV